MNLFDNDLFDKEHNSFQWTFFVPSLNQGFSRLNMLLYDKNVIFFEFLRLLNISVEQEEGLSLHISLQNFYSRILQGSPNFYKLMLNFQPYAILFLGFSSRKLFIPEKVKRKLLYYFPKLTP